MTFLKTRFQEVKAQGTVLVKEEVEPLEKEEMEVVDGAWEEALVLLAQPQLIREPQLQHV